MDTTFSRSVNTIVQEQNYKTSLQDIPEDQLIALCRQSDRRAQYELYRRYKNSLYTLALRMGMDGTDAEWALQESFVEIFKSISSYKGQSGIYAWMRTILLRSIRKTQKILIRSHELWDERIDLPEVELPDWNTDQLQKGFDQLPVGYKTVLTLYYLEEMSHKEISEFLNISEGTSRSQLFHAKQKLKNLLNI